MIWYICRICTQYYDMYYLLVCLCAYGWNWVYRGKFKSSRGPKLCHYEMLIYMWLCAGKNSIYARVCGRHRCIACNSDTRAPRGAMCPPSLFAIVAVVPMRIVSIIPTLRDAVGRLLSFEFYKRMLCLTRQWFLFLCIWRPSPDVKAHSYSLLLVHVNWNWCYICTYRIIHHIMQRFPKLHYGVPSA